MGPDWDRRGSEGGVLGPFRTPGFNRNSTYSGNIRNQFSTTCTHLGTPDLRILRTAFAHSDQQPSGLLSLGSWVRAPAASPQLSESTAARTPGWANSCPKTGLLRPILANNQQTLPTPVTERSNETEPISVRLSNPERPSSNGGMSW